MNHVDSREKETTISLNSVRGWIVVGMLASGAAGYAGERTITLRDWTGRGFAPEVVTYEVPAAGGGEAGYGTGGTSKHPARTVYRTVSYIGRTVRTHNTLDDGGRS